MAAQVTIDMSDLKDLAPLSKQLNAASDELSKALQAIQEHLNSLQFGLEVWVEGSPLETSDLQDNSEGRKEYTLTELGYGKHGDGWGLLIRTRRIIESQYDNDDAIFDDPSRQWPLLRAPRELRVAAVPVIPQLIETIENEAKRVILQVEQAKKIAESLTQPKPARKSASTFNTIPPAE